MAQRVLSVWLPNWPVQRFRAASRHAAHNINRAKTGPEPVVLIARDRRRGQLVVARCHSAARIGIKVGMSGGEATSLLEAATNSEIHPHQHDSQADLEMLQALAEACTQRFSPIVALDSDVSEPSVGPDGLLMDVTAIGPVFGGEESLCSQIDQFFRKHRLRVNVALASSIAGAWALARCKSLAEIASASENYLVTSPDTELEHLFSIPTRLMRLSPECVQTLARLGIEQFGALLRLPREGLATRFGGELMLRIDQLLDNVDEPFPAFHCRPEDSVEVDLDYPTSDRDILRYTVEGLVAQLAKGLRKSGHGALRITGQLELLKHPAVSFQIGLFAPTADADHLNHLIAENLSRTHLPADAHRVRITASLTGRLMQHQGELIADAHSSRGSSGAVANLVDKLAGRLGRQAVLGVRTLNNPLPEEAFRMQPLTGQPIGEITRQSASARRGGGRQRQSVSREQTTPTKEDPLRRPLRLLKAPIKLDVLKIDRGAPPLLFRYCGNQMQTLRFWGPERIETRWWQGPSQRRDYFRIETTDGDWLWIYRKLTTTDWYLHGLFQ